MREKKEVVEVAVPAARSEAVPPATWVGRARLASGLAAAALVAAVVGALGPAEAVRSTYSWPPSKLPEATPSSLWYTPLLLIRHRPESISATVPCSRQPALPGADIPAYLLATARFPERNGGLAITRHGRELLVRIGRAPVTRIDVPAARRARGACVYRLRLGGGRWSVSGGANDVVLKGNLATMPVVSGLFSTLDLRHARHPTIVVTTAVHASRTTLRQTLAWTLVGLGVVAALALVAVERKPRPRAVARRAMRSAAKRARLVDAVVAIVLLGWWVLSPAFWDDGWVVARQGGFSDARGFSNYYAVLGTNLPNGYWLEWIQHWITQNSNALLVLRVPSLLCLMATWVLCRWILSRVACAYGDVDRVAVWALASTFLACALAWGMTLRPEPTTALLVTGSMACAVRFYERGTVLPLAIMTLLIPLATTGHHAGVVALAPLVAVAPALLRFARAKPATVATIAMAGIAVFIALVFVGSDTTQRWADATTTRAVTPSTDTWRDEHRRYVRLSHSTWATPLRRASVALVVLSLVAFVLRYRRSRRGLTDLPAITLAAGLLLLIATPTKWPWHFGVLIGLVAVVAGTEAAFLGKEAMRSYRLEIRSFLLVAALCVAALWSWSVRGVWNPLDLRTLDWSPALEAQLSLAALAAVLPLVLLVALVLGSMRDRERRHFYGAPARVGSWAAPVLVAPIVAFTMAILVTDAARTSSWTLARQNLDTLRGELGCGLADDALVNAPHSARTTVPLARVLERDAPALILPNTLMYFPCVQLPHLSGGVAEVPGTVVTPNTSVTPVRYLASPFYGLLDLYELDRLPWAGSNPPEEILVFTVDRQIPGAVQASPTMKTISS